MTVVNPSLCNRVCALTLDGTKVKETGIYAVLFDGTRLPNGVNVTENLFALCQSGGGDICFTLDAAGANRLPAELVYINTGSKLAEIWVAVPLVAQTGLIAGQSVSGSGVFASGATINTVVSGTSITVNTTGTAATGPTTLTTATITGTIVAATANLAVISVSSTAGLAVGQAVTGGGVFSSGCTIASIGATSITVNTTSVAAVGAVTLTARVTGNVTTAVSGLATITGIASTGAVTNTKVYVWYKSNAGTLTQPAATDPFGAQAVWADVGNMVAVYHFGTPTTLSHADSTSYGNNLNTGDGAVAAGDFAGGSMAAGTGALSAICQGLPAEGGARTLQSWFKLETSSGVNTAIGGWGVNYTGCRWNHWYSSNSLSVEMAGFTTGFTWTPDNNWHSLVSVNPNGNRASSNIQMFLDGQQKTIIDGGNTFDTVTTTDGYNTHTTCIGVGTLPDYGYYNFPGEVDEFRICSIARSPNYLATDFAVQTAGSLVTVGTPSAGSATAPVVIGIPLVAPSHCQRVCKITIDGSQVLESGTYAVLLTGPNGRINSLGSRLPSELFSLCQANGEDICITSDSAGNHQLPMELVANSFSLSGETAEIWTSVLLTAGQPNYIYLWYASNTSTILQQPSSTDSYGSQAVWNGSLGIGGSGNLAKLVSHDGYTDSTGNITLSPSGSGGLGEGPLGSTWCGGYEAADTFSASPVNTADPFTLQLWAALGAGTGDIRVMSLAGAEEFELTYGYSTDVSPLFGFNGSTQFDNNTGAYDINNVGGWHWHSLSYNGAGTTSAANFTLGLDNTAIPFAADGTFTAVAGNSGMSLPAGSNGANFAAGEIRVIAAVLSANYESTDYAIQTSATMVLAGTPTSTPTPNYVTPASCAHWCPLTINGSATIGGTPQVAETGIYAVLFDGSGDSSKFGVRLPDVLFQKCQSDGGDICFTSDMAGLNLLPMELVNFDVVDKQAEIWVAVPLTLNTDTTIYVWFASLSDVLYQPTNASPYGRAAVWNGYSYSVGGTANSLAFVSHDGGLTDATGQIATAANLVSETSGHIGSASEFNQPPPLNTGTITASTVPLNTANPFTFQFWEEYEAVDTYDCILRIGATPGLSGAFMFATGNTDGGSLGGSNTLYFGYRDVGAFTSTSPLVTPDQNLQTWHQYAFTYNGTSRSSGTNYYLAVDNTGVGITGTAGIGEGGAGNEPGIALGDDSNGAGLFIGNLDEIRLTALQRSANYLATDYNIQSSPLLVTVGTPVQVSAAGTRASGESLSLGESTKCQRNRPQITESPILGESASCHNKMQHAIAVEHSSTGHALALGETASAVNASVPASTSDAVSIREVATFVNVVKRARALEGLTLNESTSERKPLINIVLAEAVLLNQPIFTHNTTSRLILYDPLTISEGATANNTSHLCSEPVLVLESASAQNTTQVLSATETLIVSEVARHSAVGTVPPVTDGLQLSETPTTVSPMNATVVEAITSPSYLVTGGSLNLTIPWGLQDAVSVIVQHANTPEVDSLALWETTVCAKYVPDWIGKHVTVTEGLVFAELLALNYGGQDGIQLGEMVLAELYGQLTNDFLAVDEETICNIRRSLFVQEWLVIEDSLTYLSPFALAKRVYNPFIGKGTKGNPAPPPITLVQNLKPGEFSLCYPPAPFAPADIVVLRKPEFGNKDRLHFDRISRETRGGTLIVFADPMWPKTQTLVLTFAALRPDQAFNLQRFMETYLGLEIGLMDWEGRQWTGVIVKPNDPVVQDSKYSFTASFEFEGQLVSELTGQTV